jgi:hypothetical protein
VLTGITLAGIGASFVWVFGWTDAGGRYFVYLEHGMLCGTRSGLPAGTALPWYGHLKVFRSGVYEPWAPVPQFELSGPWPYFKFPIHLVLPVFIAMMVYPLLPFVVKRGRRKRGLCVRCGYNLTGNVSGRCPECGREVKG